jgi:hypothetical protein
MPIAQRAFIPIMRLCSWDTTGQPKEQDPLTEPHPISTGWVVSETREKNGKLLLRW